MSTSELKRVETIIEVDTYVARLKYLINNPCSNLKFQMDRNIDKDRHEHYTNKFTINDLFPNEEPNIVLKRELNKLTTPNYIETVKDTRFPNRSEMRVFGKKYRDDIYIKIRVELLNTDCAVFVMSFHYSEFPFIDLTFPYIKR